MRIVTYEIRFQGKAAVDLLDAFEGMHLTVEDEKVTLCARLQDQAALQGLLARGQHLGLHVVGVRVLDDPGPDQT